LFTAVGRILFRLEVEGLENLPRTDSGRPAGGWICCGLPHRTWVEFFVMFVLLPPRPRLVMLADGPVMFRSWWRRLLIRSVGGVVPIWRRSGPADFDHHVAAARQTIAAGSVFGLFPEVGRPAPVPHLRRISPGIAYFALRTGAPIVPMVFGGTHELFLRRRIVVRVLPAVDARVLAGLDAAAPLPPPESVEERNTAETVLAGLRALVEPVAAAAHLAAEPPPGTRKLLRGLTGPYPPAD
jgi:1-acyl-sn-glycerol-3-phosphate acyltransferase